jgi:preprotein translocase subunit YajC
MNWLIADAMAQTPGEVAAGGGMGTFIMLGAMFLIFYFMLIRPQQKRAKEHKAMIDALAKGDEVVTAGGLLGRVSNLAENIVTLQVAQNVEIKVQRHAIQAVLPKGTLKD